MSPTGAAPCAAGTPCGSSADGNSAYLDEVQPEHVQSLQNSLQSGLVNDQTTQHRFAGLHDGGDILEFDEFVGRYVAANPNLVVPGSHGRNSLFRYKPE